MNYSAKSIFTASRSGIRTTADEMSDIAYIDVDDEDDFNTTKDCLTDSPPASVDLTETRICDAADKETCERVGVFDYFSPHNPGISKPDQMSDTMSSQNRCYLGPGSQLTTGGSGVKKFIAAHHSAKQQNGNPPHNDSFNEDVTDSSSVGDNWPSFSGSKSRFWVEYNQRQHNQHFIHSNSKQYDDSEPCADGDDSVVDCTDSLYQMYDSVNKSADSVKPEFRHEFDSSTADKRNRLNDGSRGWQLNYDALYKTGTDKSKEATLGSDLCDEDNVTKSYRPYAERSSHYPSDSAKDLPFLSRSADGYGAHAVTSRNSSAICRSSEHSTVVSAATSVRCSTGVDTCVGFPLSSAGANSRHGLSRLDQSSSSCNWLSSSSSDKSLWGPRNGLAKMSDDKDFSHQKYRVDNFTEDQEVGRRSGSDEGEPSDRLESTTETARREGSELVLDARSSLVGRAYPGSLCYPQYHLMQDDDEEEARRKTRGQFERMQQRRQNRLIKQTAGFSKASNVAGYRGEDSLDNLLSYIDASSGVKGNNVKSKKAVQKDKKPSSKVDETVQKERTLNVRKKRGGARSKTDSSASVKDETESVDGAASVSYLTDATTASDSIMTESTILSADESCDGNPGILETFSDPDDRVTDILDSQKPSGIVQKDLVVDKDRELSEIGDGLVNVRISIELHEQSDQTLPCSGLATDTLTTSCYDHTSSEPVIELTKSETAVDCRPEENIDKVEGDPHYRNISMLSENFSGLNPESDVTSETGSADETFITVQKKKRSKNTVTAEEHPQRHNYRFRISDEKETHQPRQPRGFDREGYQARSKVIGERDSYQHRKPLHRPPDAFVPVTSVYNSNSLRQGNSKSAFQQDPDSSAQSLSHSALPGKTTDRAGSLYSVYANSTKSATKSSLSSNPVTMENVDPSVLPDESKVVCDGAFTCVPSSMSNSGTSVEGGLPTAFESEKQQITEQNNMISSGTVLENISDTTVHPQTSTDVKSGGNGDGQDSSPVKSKLSKPQSTPSLSRGGVFLDTRKVAETTPPRTDISFGFDPSTSPQMLEPPPASPPSCQPPATAFGIAAAGCHCSLGTPVAPVLPPGYPGPVYYVLYQPLPSFAPGRCTPIGVVPPMPVISVASVPVEPVALPDDKPVALEPKISTHNGALVDDSFAVPPAQQRTASNSCFDLFATQCFLYHEFEKVLESEKNCLPGQCLVVHYSDVEVQQDP